MPGFPPKFPGFPPQIPGFPPEFPYFPPNSGISPPNSRDFPPNPRIPPESPDSPPKFPGFPPEFPDSLPNPRIPPQIPGISPRIPGSPPNPRIPPPFPGFPPEFPDSPRIPGFPPHSRDFPPEFPGFPRRLFPRRCSRCLGAVGRSEPIQRVLERIFHERCFQCGACARRLRRGDQFVLRGERLLCRGHFPGGRASPGCGSPEPSESARSEDEEGAHPHGKGEAGKDPKRSKRPRTILSSLQRRAFKASFELSSKPCRKVRETLAAETGLTVRVVQVWFQNQRAKMKKIARRQQQQQQQQQQQEQLGNSRLGSARGAGRSGRESNEEEGEGAGGAPGLEGILVPYSRIPPQPLLPLEQNGFGTELGMFRPGMTPPQLHPYDSEGVFQELPGDALGSLGELLIPAENSQQLLRLGSAAERAGNAIDRLCSMHSSYFSS
ncbi:LIM homeobox transcription factor 1-alpha-like [Corvus hawaiiensis]|uniref:LIM homeobox transcription factor 1-alpha-like n=1 Tax=Corvus hawaiiensis TaxID=134902 RepID=UPI002019D99A|nr:LIM homeobox transcription factor 1-alpha-like [Corvus hawaiiensis]